MARDNHSFTAFHLMEYFAEAQTSTIEQNGKT